MREILFRGKRIDNGEWVEGYLIHDKDDGLYRIVIKLEYSTGTYIVTGFAPRVNVKTIGQYTGLTDKNGKRIFEGDILHVSSDLKAIVTWLAEESRYLLEFYVDGNKYESGLYEMPVKGYKVIGNIHDSKLEDFVNGG